MTGFLFLWTVAGGLDLPDPEVAAGDRIRDSLRLEFQDFSNHVVCSMSLNVNVDGGIVRVVPKPRRPFGIHRRTRTLP